MNETTTSPTQSRRTRRRATSLVIAVGLALAACGSDDAGDDPVDTAATADSPSASIADPWSRQPAEGQDRSAVYGVVTNSGDEAITAVSAAVAVAERVELHETTMNDEGQMSMSEKEGGYQIAPGESLTFEPGGPHIMLFGIDAATYPDSVAVSLEFDNGETLSFDAEVRAIGDEMDMGDGDMEMDDGDMDGEMEMEDGEMTDG